MGEIKRRISKIEKQLDEKKEDKFIKNIEERVTNIQNELNELISLIVNHNK